MPLHWLRPAIFRRIDLARSGHPEIAVSDPSSLWIIAR
jgi:hypothetical protein